MKLLLKSSIKFKMLLVAFNILFFPLVSLGQTGITAATGSIINDYAAVTNISGSTITVDSNNGFTAGDTGLLIQMKGSSVSRIDDSSHGNILSYGSAGRFEFVNIESVINGSVTLKDPPVVFFQTTGVVQLIRVSSYVNQTLSGTISAKPWDGNTGGVVAIDATGTLTLTGVIDVTGLGFQGGSLVNNIPFDNCISDLTNYTGTMANGSGNKGEGIVVHESAHRAMRGHNANGGGGGNITDAAGGGGGNFGAGGIGGRELDICDDGIHGGLGGQALDYSPMNRVFMGGGGGSGSEVSQVAKGGARGGGGIVVIRANKLTVSGGSILANGLTSNNDDGNGADGGGAGGSVALVIQNGITGVLPIEAIGGNGGDENNPTNAHGPGGGGGGGGVLLNGPSCTNINAITNGGVAGVSLIGTSVGDPNWGAESGQTGQCVENFIEISHVEPESSLSGHIFKDENKNDIFETTELGIASVSVWVQIVNADGTIDPARTYSSADAQGYYQFKDLADGNYQVYVNTTDANLPSDHTLGGLNPLVISINSTSVTDADFPFDEVVCTAFSGEVNEAALPLSSQLKTTDKLFVPSKSISPISGHLRAYAIDDYGVAASTASWDAATLMGAANRSSNLYSTDASGNKIAFNSLDDVAITSVPSGGDDDDDDGSSSTLATKIKQYTIDPSADGGIYLAGRENGSFLGGISKGNELDILSNKINVSLYLSDTAYRSYYSGTVATRSQRVLISSDDGFLYAFDYNTGDLVWGWMPRTLASDLIDYTDFQSKHLMSGSIDVLDLADGSGSYATYVVGSYKGGLGHYVLKLNAAGGLDSVIWDDDQSGIFTKSPNNGEIEFFKDGSGKTYAAYVLANDVAASRLKIKSLADSSEDMSVDLNYQASSTPFVMPDYGKNNAPANKTLYLGSSNGDIHAGKVLESDGSLSAASDIQAYLQASSVTSMDDSASDAVLYMNSSISAKNSLYYLSSQTATRLTLHRYKASNTSWNKAWTSYSSGAGSWDDSGTYSADSSGVPSKDADGFNIIPPTGIQSLPVDATITAKAVIVGDSVVLPLSVLPSSSSACYGKAYYYLYSLSDGVFPANTFFNNDGTEIITDIALGYGEAKQLSITDMAGTNKLLGFGMADKKADLTSGIAKSFVIKDPVAVGIRGWKEIGR